MSTTAATGSGLRGRFLSHYESWQFENILSGETVSGDADPLAALNSLLQDLKSRNGLIHPGAVGYVSFDWGSQSRRSARLPSSSENWRLPHMQFLVFEQLTHPDPRLEAPRTSKRQSYTREELDALVRRDGVRALVSKFRYLADVSQLKEHIAAGDIYQANYTQGFEISTFRTSPEIASSLVARLPAPYSAHLRFGSATMVSTDGSYEHFPEMAVIAASPERFWRLQDGVLDSRPIKGTIGRANSTSEDRELRRRLLTSRKDRAELLMITDLVRNDLGQVAEIGSVKTQALVRIRPTPSVWHLESTVTARLARTRSWMDVMKSLHPAGSISGTPKLRALEILDTLEKVRRGPYCGAIGWIDSNGNADFAVAIRTCVQVGKRIRVYGGGGIVADSDPEAEYYESLVKIATILELLCESPSLDRGAILSPTREDDA
jgi:anthranilate/para-aminobenzoate synthase component I